MELTNHSLKKYFPLRRKDKSYWRFDSRLVSPQALSTNFIQEEHFTRFLEAASKGENVLQESD